MWAGLFCWTQNVQRKDLGWRIFASEQRKKHSSFCRWWFLIQIESDEMEIDDEPKMFNVTVFDAVAL